MHMYTYICVRSHTCTSIQQSACIESRTHANRRTSIYIDTHTQVLELECADLGAPPDGALPKGACKPGGGAHKGSKPIACV